MKITTKLNPQETAPKDRLILVRFEGSPILLPAVWNPVLEQWDFVFYGHTKDNPEYGALCVSRMVYIPIVAWADIPSLNKWKQ